MNKKIFLTALIALCVLCAYSCSPRQSTRPDDELNSLKKDIETLKAGQTAIQKDLQEIKSILQGRQAPPPPEFKEATLSIKDDQFKGNKEAKVVLIEFMDYQ
ncbi:MAG: hypothetical protein NT096_13415 [Proteobacteria bacterium]|nr:hypothetical protein [Pseudomonadota bacterium]